MKHFLWNFLFATGWEVEARLHCRDLVHQLKKLFDIIDRCIFVQVSIYVIFIAILYIIIKSASTAEELKMCRNLQLCSCCSVPYLKSFCCSNYPPKCSSYGRFIIFEIPCKYSARFTSQAQTPKWPLHVAKMNAWWSPKKIQLFVCIFDCFVLKDSTKYALIPF